HDQPVLEDAQRVGREGGAGGGDVDDQVGRAGGGGRLGGARTLDDAVFGNAVFGEVAAREVDVFGGHPQPAAVPGAEVRGDVGEVDHLLHVDPGVGHRHHHVGLAEAEAAHEQHVLLAIFGRLVDEIGAGHADIDAAEDQLPGDLRGGVEAHRYLRLVLDGADIGAGAAGAGDGQPRGGERLAG